MNRNSASSITLVAFLGAGASSVVAQPAGPASGGTPGAAAAPRAPEVIVRMRPAGGADSATCYANCDGSTTPPYPFCVNVLDFACFANQYAAALSLPVAQQITSYANCDGSTTPPVLNALDFACFLNKYAAGCTSC